MDKKEFCVSMETGSNSWIITSKENRYDKI